MKKYIYIILLIIANTAYAQDVSIVADLELKKVINALLTEFEKQSGLKTNIVYKSSKSWKEDIDNKKLYDVIISADNLALSHVLLAGFSEDKIKNFAFSELSFWTLQDFTLSHELNYLKDDKIKNIGILKKDNDFGTATIKIFQRQKLYNLLKIKFIEANNLTQLHNWVMSKKIDVAIVPSFYVKNLNLGKWKHISSPQNQKVGIGYLFEQQFGAKKNAQLLKNFLQSGTTESILRAYGYLPK